MAIIHHRSGEDRAEIKNNPEMNNEDGIITYVFNKESKDGSSSYCIQKDFSIQNYLYQMEQHNYSIFLKIPAI